MNESLGSTVAFTASIWLHSQSLPACTEPQAGISSPRRSPLVQICDISIVPAGVHDKRKRKDTALLQKVKTKNKPLIVDWETFEAGECFEKRVFLFVLDVSIPLSCLALENECCGVLGLECYVDVKFFALIYTYSKLKSVSMR